MCTSSAHYVTLSSVSTVLVTAFTRYTFKANTCLFSAIVDGKDVFPPKFSNIIFVRSGQG